MSVADAIEAATQIPGWMSPEELQWLGEAAEGRKVIVEVGSYLGRSTKVLAMMGDKVYSVDNLRGEDIRTESGGSGPWNGKDLNRHIRENLVGEKVIFVRKPSLTAAKEFQGKADMVFIDADHETEAVKKDIEAWSRRLAPGGLLCGHDRGDERVDACLAELEIHGRGPDRIWFR